MDGLRLTSAPLVPEVRLFLAEDSTLWWARLEAHAGRALPAPYWASAWSGGLGVARYVLDRPETVLNQRVLDLASGSGLVAIAAALAGAVAVVANDVDPDAAVAARANARANGVAVDTLVGDLLDGAGAGGLAAIDVDVVLVGDALYTDGLAERLLPALVLSAARGVRVLLGDPGRGRVPTDSWETLVTYQLPVCGAHEDTQISQTSVLRPSVAASGEG